MENQKEQLSELIGRYEALPAAERKKYNEANTRKNFILPLFDILGWDIRSDDVSEEERASGKRVDYAFKINGITKFFIEAKSLSSDLDEIKWSEQAIWYAYHKSVPWVVLTNFEKIKVFNAEWNQPEPETSLFFELKYSEYLENFEKLSLLSRESVENGELDKKALEWGKKPKTVSTVGERLTEDLLNWRDNLFNDLVGYNPGIKKEAAADSVQKFINRLIFIRTCEDRGLEQKRLQEVLRAWEDGGNKNNDLVKRIQALFSGFNDNYDSKLFEDKIIFDADSDNLIFEESVIAKIIEETYKNSRGIRWNFNDINADVLGSVYEQYLGQIQSGKANKEEEKSSKRKSQGIYYTPRYIVDYIVKNTLGEALKGKTFNEILKLKVLDPACGSGSFLIRAFEEALSHLRKETGKINRDFDDYALRWSVLTSMIYGVDLDQEAVEITQLNLLLKTLGRREKLPNLSNKIDCGNSLISGAETELKKYFGKNWKYKKSFNWEERFPEVFKQGGFDVIIGNPPWGAEIKDQEKKYYKTDFDSANGIIDTFALFIEKSFLILKNNGYLGFILPDIILLKNYPVIRKLILENFKINYIFYAGMAFKNVNLDSVVLILQKEESEVKRNENLISINNQEGGLSEIKQNLFLKNKDYKFNLSFNKETLGLKSKLEANSIKLGELLEIHEGIHSGNIREKLFIDNCDSSYCKKLLFKGVEINRYLEKWNGKYVNYNKNIINKDQKEYANLCREDYFINPKILVRRTGDRILASIDKDGYFVSNNFFVIFYSKDVNSKINLKYILTILNSNIGTWYFLVIQPRKGKLFAEIKINHLSEIPIPKIDFSDEKEKQKHDELVKLADKMLELNKKLQKIDPILDEEEYKELKTEIDKTDKEIDEKVYKLYGLTPEEIKIMGGSTK